ncbi:uncharacterized protein N7484_008038 [Penicillium longicatenatum]|uniref:uncharacterized protein n=1 Tax=Penicillium longicatenatum TaxID=1561947 RepID=UPI0025490859|nr:uncharacterized protein N7484_008038 [Penicillium longicatenatum]KAJ5640176.1 hypothetical protein N7484_008038 [Penicillium longicatenatum]
MKQAFVSKDTTVAIRDTEIPVPKQDQVLIRVVVSGTNPKDWKVPRWIPNDNGTNEGDDIAGYVEAVGEGVVGFQKGDKVAAFHQMMTTDGSYAEYAIAPAHTTFHLPAKTSFEEAATVPLAAMTAALGLYQRLDLPLPWNPTSEPLPLVVYGGASAVGAFALKLAKLSNIHPLIVVAGKSSSFVETLIDRSKGDTIIDYREGDEAVRAKIKAAAGGKPIHHAFDAVSEKGSTENLRAALTAPGKITTVLPTDAEKDDNKIAVHRTMVGSVHDSPTEGKTIEDREFGAIFFPFLGRGLAGGWFSGHPHEVRPGGLGGLQGALQDLANGKASAVKYVVRIGETDGVSQ